MLFSNVDPMSKEFQVSTVPFARYPIFQALSRPSIFFRIQALSTLTTPKYFCENYGDQRAFQLEIIINDLVGSFCFI